VNPVNPVQNAYTRSINRIVQLPVVDGAAPLKTDFEIGTPGRSVSADTGLDPAKINTANGAMSFYSAGDSANTAYLRDLERIDALPAGEAEKQMYRDESRRRWEALLDVTINNPSWAMTGRAGIDPAKTSAGADKVAHARSYAASYVDTVENK
jgi:hypothetical protein